MVENELIPNLEEKKKQLKNIGDILMMKYYQTI
jgi:hypothetical protein